MNQDTLAKFARSISLGSYLMLGRGETESHGCDRDSTLSDAFEAVCGAIYLDQGSALVTEFILKTLHTNCREPSDLLHSLNPKGLLQEYAQAHFGKAPEYKILGVSGPAHNPCYEVEVLVNGELLAKGVAAKRKLAEQAAAKAAMEVLSAQRKNNP